MARNDLQEQWHRAVQELAWTDDHDRREQLAAEVERLEQQAAEAIEAEGLVGPPVRGGFTRRGLRWGE